MKSISLAKQVKSLRDNLWLTQEEAARRWNIPYSTYCRVEQSGSMGKKLHRKLLSVLEKENGVVA